MSKIGKWNCISQVDSRQFANCPMQMSNDFVEEIDQNPAAPRRPFWMDPNYVRPEKRQSFLREDTDTVDEDWCCKQIIMGKTLGGGTPNYTRWSIVVRTVIRWEERKLRRITIRNTKSPTGFNHKPTDIQIWEATHGKFRTNRSSKRNPRRSRKRCA